MEEEDGGEVTVADDTTSSTPGHDEKFCTDCGSVIKKRAEMCPECGVEQSTPDQTTNQEPAQTTGLTDRRQYELEKVASKDKSTVILVSLLVTPLGYWMIGKKALALVNFFTANFLFMGFLIVPIHTYKIISDAEEELRRAGIEGY